MGGFRRLCACFHAAVVDTKQLFFLLLFQLMYMYVTTLGVPSECLPFNAFTRRTGRSSTDISSTDISSRSYL